MVVGCSLLFDRNPVCLESEKSIKLIELIAVLFELKKKSIQRQQTQKKTDTIYEMIKNSFCINGTNHSLIINN